MIRIRYSPGEYEVAGSPADLRSVAERLKSLALVGTEEVLVCDDSFDPVPYSALLPRLKLIKKEGRDRVSASEEELTISGSSQGLHRFASFFEMPDDADDGWHEHHEFFPGNDFVATDSLRLVISVERTRPNQRPEGTPGNCRFLRNCLVPGVPHP